MLLVYLPSGRDFPNASKSRLDMERWKFYQPEQGALPSTKILVNIPIFGMDNQCSSALEKLFK